MHYNIIRYVFEGDDNSDNDYNLIRYNIIRIDNNNLSAGE